MRIVQINNTFPKNVYYTFKITFCDAIFPYRDALSLAVEAIFAAPADNQLKLDAKDETVESSNSCD